MQTDISQITDLFGVLLRERRTGGRLSVGSLPNNIEKEEAAVLKEQGIAAMPSHLRSVWQWFSPGDSTSLRNFLTSRWADRGLHLRQARYDPESNRALLENVIEMTHCWLDVDVKYLVDAYAAHGQNYSLPEWIDILIERLQDWQMPPAAIVKSGGGVHAYWPLTPSAALPGELDAAEECNTLLARVWGGDVGAGRRNHSLRLPGTVNRNYEPTRMAKLVTCAPRSYPLADLIALCQSTHPLFGLGELLSPEERELSDMMLAAGASLGTRLNKGGRAKTTDEWGTMIAKLSMPGSRHAAALSIAGKLVKQGQLAPPEIVQALINHGCDLSLPEITEAVDYVVARNG